MNKEYPETMQEFMDRFPDEEACRSYLAEVRWGGAFTCPCCSSNTAWKIRRGKFRCALCGRDMSVTAGTVFQHTRIPLRLWFQAIWCLASQKHGASALGLSRVLGISRQKTGWHLLRKIRSAMVRPGRERLSGVVEVDEVFIGGVRARIGGRSSIGKTLILIAAEDKIRTFGRIRIQIIPDASFQSLSFAVEAMIDSGSTLHTDGWLGYRGIEKRGYRHVITERKPSLPGDDPTPLVHRIASLLKRWLLGTHQGGVQPARLQAYLDEFVFRFNRRTSRSRGKLFFRLIQHMTHPKVV